MSDKVCEPAASSIAEEDCEEFKGVEYSPAHTPATEREFLATNMNSYFDFREEDPLPLLIPLILSALFWTCWSRPTSLLLSKSLTVYLPKPSHFLPVPLFLLSLFSSPQPLPLPSPRCLPSAPQSLLCLLSVVWQHLRPTVSQLPVGLGIPWLCLRPQILSFLLDLLS